MVLIKVNDVGPGDRKREYLLFWDDAMKRFCAGVVEDSFKIDGVMRHPTRAEIGDRIKMVKKLADELWTEFKWSKPRVKDHLSVILRARLVGLHVDVESLSKRGSW